MRTARILPGPWSAGQQPAQTLAGAVLTRDIVVAGQRWSKGRRLSREDLDHLGHPHGRTDLGPRLRVLGAAGETLGVTVLVLEPGDLHEDDAACRLAVAIKGPGLTLRGPAESRVDLVAEADGVVHVEIERLERFNRVDPLEAFTVYDGQIVKTGDLVASVKVAPHVVSESVVARGEAVASSGPLVRVAPFTRHRVAVVVKESLARTARERFERSARQKIEGIGSSVVDIAYVADALDAVQAAMGRFTRGPDAVELVMTAGAASTDPDDPFFVAVRRLRGRIVRHGVPAHPGSMLWLARIGRTAVLGLPTCGAYSRATAADLLLPRLLSGDPATAATVARLGHGGVLSRSMRFRFPAYALDLDAPEG